MRLVTRAEWGARPPKSIGRMSASEGIFVHYTVTPTGPEAQVVRNVQAFHMDSRGWNDIAYSFLVGQSGDVYEGRGWGVTGGHTEGWNRRSHAVCWIGNTEQPTPEALASIAWVIDEHHRRYGRGFVRPHRAVNSTSCPGEALTAWIAAGGNAPQVDQEDDVTPEDIEQIAKRVTAYLASPAHNPGTVIDPGARNALAAIHRSTSDPDQGIRAILLAQQPGGTIDVAGLAAQLVDQLDRTDAKAVADELARRLAG